jgi:hypothetical protein
MQTVRHIQRLWDARKHQQLLHLLIGNRPENSVRLEPASTCIPAAAMGAIRLDELNQSHVPLYTTFVKTLVATQEKDGGWGDPMTTALCLRALMAGKGAGLAIERGLVYLANLQKTEGIWPKIPIRRTPVEPLGSAFVLYQLGEDARFRAAVRFEDAVNWFETHESTLDAEIRRLWDRASLRCRMKYSNRSVLTPVLS